MHSGGRFSNLQTYNMELVTKKYLPAIQRGMDYLATDQYENAEAEFSLVIQEAPAIFIANFSYFLLLRNVPLVHPRRSFVHTCLGRAYLEQNKIPNARIELDYAIAANNQNAAAYFYRGCASQQEDALSNLNKALELDTKLAPNVYLRRAEVYLAHGDATSISRAIMDFLQAAKLNPTKVKKYKLETILRQPDNVVITLACGFAEYYLGNFPKAIEHFKNTLPLIDSYSEKWIRKLPCQWIIMCCEEMARHDIAIKIFSDLIDFCQKQKELKDEHTIHYLIYRAHAYLATHNLKAAAQDILGAQKLQNTYLQRSNQEVADVQAYLTMQFDRYIGYRALVMADYNEAVMRLMNAYSQDKEDEMTLLAVVALSVNDEDIRLGFDTINYFLEHHPYSNIGHYLRGRLALLTKLHDTAIADFISVLFSPLAHSQQKLASALELYRLGMLDQIITPTFLASGAAAAATSSIASPTTSLELLVDACKHDCDANTQYLCTASFVALKQYDKANAYLTKLLTNHTPTSVNIVYRQDLLELLAQQWCWPTTSSAAFQGPYSLPNRDEWMLLLQPNASDKTKLRRAKANLFLQRFIPGTLAATLLPPNYKYPNRAFSLFANNDILKENCEELKDITVNDISEDTLLALRNAHNRDHLLIQLEQEYIRVYHLLYSKLQEDQKAASTAAAARPAIINHESAYAAIATAPSTAHIVKAVAYLTQNKLPLASVELDQALQHDPQNLHVAFEKQIRAAVEKNDPRSLVLPALLHYRSILLFQDKERLQEAYIDNLLASQHPMAFAAIYCWQAFINLQLLQETKKSEYEQSAIQAINHLVLAKDHSSVKMSEWQLLFIKIMENKDLADKLRMYHAQSFKALSTKIQTDHARLFAPAIPLASSVAVNNQGTVPEWSAEAKVDL